MSVMIMNSDGKTSVVDSIDAYYEGVRKNLKTNAQQLVASMNAANVDLTLLAPAQFVSKETNQGGKKFKVYIFTAPAVTQAISRKTGKTIKSVIQIWNGSRSVILPQPEEVLENARLNWREEKVIPADLLVEQTIAALRLNSDQPVIHHLAMFLAYEHKDVRGELCHRVWD